MSSSLSVSTRDRNRFVENVVFEHRENLVEGGIVRAVGLDQLIDLMGFECVGLEIDDIDRAGGVAERLLRWWY